MIQLFLVIYALVTVIPFCKWMYEEYIESKKQKVKTLKSDEADKALMDLQKALEAQGIKAKLHRLPEDPIEATMVQSTHILDALSRMDKGNIQWFSYLRNKIDENSKDLHAIMMSEESLLKNMKELTSPSALAPLDTAPATKTHEQFATYFEYARDNLPVDPKEKEVINSIIKRLKQPI